jgi:hypothetical protein
MCPKAGEGPSSLHTYDPTIKCCTFLPELHNFLVGRVLADRSPDAAEGRETVVARVRSRAAVTPLGLGKPRAYTLLYRNQGRNDFGSTRSFRCPHYLEDGRCGVWRHRESTCATWFCKHVRGANGAGFWRAVHQLLQAVERSLARSCILELDPGAEALEHLFHVPSPVGQSEVPLDGVLEPSLYKRLWGRWAGREAEFFEACARIVAGLTWKDVLARSGPEVALQARVVTARFARLSANELPERLWTAPFQIVSLTSESARLATYSRLDPIDIPRELFDALASFDGRETTEVVSEIARERRLRLAPDLIRRLVDFEVLNESGGAPRNP